MIEAGKIKEARRVALKHFYNNAPDVRQSIIEMFKATGPKTHVCPQCKCTAAYEYNPAFLAYDTNKRVCPACDVKLAQVAKENDLADKAKALVSWREKQLTMIDSSMSLAGVPVDFLKARMSDLGHATVIALKGDQSYFLKGNVGVGKSHMAAALIRQYLESLKPRYDERNKEYYMGNMTNKLPCFIEVPELLLRIRDTYSKDSNESEKDIVDLYSKAPFLVLDDLGVEKASDFSTLMMYLIINRRCTSGKTTIITSNLDLAEIKERLSDRISSRIRGMCKEITVAGNDKRYINER